MKVTLYRYEKGTLVMRSVEMEKLQAALRTENLNKPISTTRDKVMFALPGTQNSDIQKLPVVVFGGTFRKTGEPKASHARLFGIGAARSKPSFRLARSGTNPPTSRHDAANATGIRRL